jgi:hypothetical protein
MTSDLAILKIPLKLALAYIAYLIMLLNHVYLSSSTIGIIGFSIYLTIVGIWLGKLYGGHSSIVHFLIGCFIFLSLTVILVGTVVYFMVFSALTVWLFLASIPIACYFFEKRIRIEEPKRNVFSLTHFVTSFGITRRGFAKIAVLIVAVSVGSAEAWATRTGLGISHIGQVISYSFWPILVFSFFMLYLVQREEKLSSGLKLLFMFLVAFLVFGTPLMVYRNYVTEDSFGLLGDVKSIIQTGVYGWVPHLARSGYFAITSLIVVASSAQSYVGEIYKLQTSLIVSVYAPLFIYLILEKITKKKQAFLALVSIFLFPTLLFISVPLEKSIATAFFLGSFWFALLFLENSVPRKVEIAVMGLILLAIPFLHDYFAVFAAVPVILALFFRLSTITGKRSISLLAAISCLVGLLIPLSFVLGSSVLKTTLPTTFSFPKIGEVIGFLLPTTKLPLSVTLDQIIYSYSDNFVWIRYVLLLGGSMVLIKSAVLRERRKTKFWLIATVLAFWIGYFLLRTSTQNPPEAAKDYRFGFFVDLSLIPLAGIISVQGFEKMKGLKIQIGLSRHLREHNCSIRPPRFTLAILLILIMTVSIYCGFNFDRIMERPIDAQGIGRYVVTDEEMQAMQYVQNISGNMKNAVLTDSHMGGVAQGALSLNFSKAQLFNLNSGGALQAYFNNMRHDPSKATMYDLMNQTNAKIGFFIIGLNDWKGWQPENAYWIDSNAIETLKVISTDWKSFGENSDLFVFVFQGPR